MEKIRVVIADDHPPFREGLCRLLDDEKEIQVVGKAADGEEAVNLSRDLNPDVAILDISMPKVNGIEATKQIKGSSPNTNIIMLSAFIYHSYVIESLRAGATGYITKDAPLPELLSAIRVANSGDRIIDRCVANNLIKRLVSDKNNSIRNIKLHSREVEVLKLAAKGLRNKEIAKELYISDRTVQAHMVKIFSKLDVNSRTEAVLQALKDGHLAIWDLGN